MVRLGRRWSFVAVCFAGVASAAVWSLSFASADDESKVPEAKQADPEAESQEKKEEARKAKERRKGLKTKRVGFNRATREQRNLLVGTPTSQLEQLPPRQIEDLINIHFEEAARQREYLQDAVVAKRGAENELMKVPGVAGCGVSLDANGEPFIRVFITGEIASRLPDAIDGIPVKTELTAPFKFWYFNPPEFDQRARWPRPVPIGVSSINATSACASGTLGCRVIDRSTGNVMALSNNHVYANLNEAAIGSPAIQPSQGDQNCETPAADHIGTLARFVPIVFSETANNRVDAAVVATTTELVDRITLPDGYGAPVPAFIPSYVGMGVQKYGRTTGFQFGRVITLDMTVVVGGAQFIEQIEHESIGEPFGAPGDSGSLIVDMMRFPSALLYAGSGPDSVLGNNIRHVMDELGVDIDGDAQGTDFRAILSRLHKNARFQPIDDFFIPRR
jgi:hypothetical protein